MKPEICENCGSRQFREQEDAYVCTYCDTFYLKRKEPAQEIRRYDAPTQVHQHDGPKQVHFGEVVDSESKPKPEKNRKKNKWVTLVLCLLLGCYGAHKFYEGKIFMGLLYLFTQGLFGVGVIVDLILILLKPNPYYV